MKGKAIAMGLSELFQERNGNSPELLQGRVRFFFTIIVLFQRSPIVEISALLWQLQSPIFNYLRLAA